MSLIIVKKVGDLEYIIFTPLVWATIFLLFSVAFTGLYLNNFSLEPKFYVECPYEDGCFNMFYNSPACIGSPYEYTPICTQNFIRYGSSIGDKPDFITANLSWITFLIVGVFIFLNTLLFNKGFIGKLKLGDRLE